MNPLILRLVAVMLLLGAIFAGWYGYSISKNDVKQPIVETSPPLKSQVVAARAIMRGTVLSEDDLKIEEVAVPAEGSFERKSDLLDRVVLSDLPENAVIARQALKYLGPVATFLAPGERGVAIKVDEVVGVGGYIRPGDHVDVLLYINADMGAKIPSSSQLLLSDLRVISYGELLQDKPRRRDDAPSVTDKLDMPASVAKDEQRAPSLVTKSAVLAVNESDITRLMLGSSIGQLRLALRGRDAPGTQKEIKRDAQYLSAPQLQLPPAVDRAADSQHPNKKTAVTRPRNAEPTAKSVVIYSGDKKEVINFGDHQ